MFGFVVEQVGNIMSQKSMFGFLVEQVGNKN